jgi:acetoin utilization deacetylase AcuC-like enzyme
MKVYYPKNHLQHNPPYEGYNQDGGIPALEVPERALQVYAALQQVGWAEILPPAEFDLEPILAVHSRSYLDYLRTVYSVWEPRSPLRGTAFFPGTYGLDTQAVLAGDVPEQAGFFLMDTTVSGVLGTYAAALQSAQAALSAAQAVSQGQDAAFALCRPPGHHAGGEVCGGYCYLNNAAIAAQWLSLLGKVAILDVDYHAGNGTQDIFYQRADVFTISIHADPSFEYPRYAGFAGERGVGPGTGFHRNFPLPAGTDEAAYLPVLERALALIDHFAPRHLVVSVGMDTYKDDPLGTFKLTCDGLHQVGSRIAALNLPTVLVMEGGYHLPSMGANLVAFLEAFQTRQA